MASRVKKTPKSRSNTAVQGTNDSSVVSKWSMADVGYVDDKFIQYFVSKKCRRSPLINRGYWIRHKAVKTAQKYFLIAEQDRRCQIVSLGAGFDSSYFLLKSQNMLSNCYYVEIDFPAVAQKKASLIKYNDLLKAETKETVIPQVQEYIAFQSPGYVLLGLDLTQLELVEACLSNLGVSTEAPTLILSEVVLAYLTPRSANSIIEWAADYFEECMMVTYEQILPFDSFGQIMTGHFKKLGTPLRCIEKYPELQDQTNRYHQLGWPAVSAVDMNHFYLHHASSDEKHDMASIEPFDEQEEWFIKCQHYVLICSYKNMTRVGDLSCQAALPFPKHWSTSGSEHRSSQSCQWHMVDSVTDGDMQLSGDSVAAASDLSNTNNSCVFRQQTARHTEASYPAEKPHTSDSHRTVPKPPTPESHLPSLQPLLDLYPSKPPGWSQRFGHAACMVGPDVFAVTGGFGQCGHQHRRQQDVTLVRVLRDPCSSPRSAHVPSVSRSSQPPASNQHSSTQTSPSDEASSELPSQTSANNRATHSPELCLPYGAHRIRPHGLVDLGTDGRVLTPLERLYHSMTLLSDGRLVVWGGRSSPLQAFSPLCVLSFEDQAAGCGNDSLLKNSEQMCEPSKTETEPGSPSSDDHESSQCLPSINCEIVQESGDVPKSRWRHVACTVILQGEEYVFIHGGKTVDAGVVSDAALLHTSTWTWTQATYQGQCLPPRYSHSAAVMTNNRILISGGMNEDFMPQSSLYLVEFLDRCKDTIMVDVKILQTQQPLPSVFSHMSFVQHDMLYIVGGVSLQPLDPQLTTLDLNTKNVTHRPIQVPSDCCPLLLHNMQLVLSSNQEQSSCKTGNKLQLGDSGLSRDSEKPGSSGGSNAGIEAEGCNIDLFLIGGGGNCFSFGTHLNSGFYHVKVPAYNSPGYQPR